MTSKTTLDVFFADPDTLTLVKWHEVHKIPPLIKIPELYVQLKNENWEEVVELSAKISRIIPPDDQMGEETLVYSTARIADIARLFQLLHQYTVIDYSSCCKLTELFTKRDFEISATYKNKEVDYFSQGQKEFFLDKIRPSLQNILDNCWYDWDGIFHIANILVSSRLREDDKISEKCRTDIAYLRNCMDGMADFESLFEERFSTTPSLSTRREAFVEEAIRLNIENCPGMDKNIRACFFCELQLRAYLWRADHAPPSETKERLYQLAKPDALRSCHEEVKSWIFRVIEHYSLEQLNLLYSALDLPAMLFFKEIVAQEIVSKEIKYPITL